MPKGVLISKALIAQLTSDRSKYLPNETGGYLLGKRSAGHIEIVGATHQGPRDKATPWSFDRLDESHHLAAHSQWKRDEGRTGMLGDWHSHPTGDGTPSGQDRKAWSILNDHSRGAVIGIVLGEQPPLRVFRCAKKFGILRVAECIQVYEDDVELTFTAS